MSSGLIVVAMLAVGGPIAVLTATPAHAGTGGPVILDGMDEGLHGSESSGTLVGPWIFIGKAYQNLMGASTFGTDGDIAVIGASDSTASFDDCGAAAHYAAAADGYTNTYYGTSGAIDTFFTQLAAGTISPMPRLIHIVDSVCNNNLTDAEALVLTSHASDIADYVAAGGALFANTETREFEGNPTDRGYAWLATLLPGITITGDIGRSTPLLTAAGTTAFPGLTNENISSPWHSGFGGTFGNLQVLATDSGANVIIGGSSVVLTAALDLSAPAPPPADVGAAYTDTLTATGGTGPYTYAVTAGALPDGLTLDSATGIISGTPTVDGLGTADFTVTATDSLSATAAQALSIVVAAAPTLSVSAPPNGEVGAAYTDTLAMTGGTAPATWSVTTGSLPDGLTLDASTGVISGTPLTDSVGAASFTVQVTDSLGQTATQPLSITIVAAPSLSVVAPDAGEVGAAYTDTLAATDGTGPFAWSITTGDLPDGLTLDTSTGVISGTPTSGAVGDAHFTVQVTDSLGQSATQALSLAVVAAPVLEVEPPPAGEVGVTYSNALVPTFGTGPFTFSITIGSLPAGLTLNPSTGVISGTPTAGAVGGEQFTVHVVDSLSQSADQPLSLVIAAAPSLSVPAPAAGEVAVPYTNTFVPTGGTGAYTWAVSAGALPAGVTLDAATGVVSGTPLGDAAGTAHFTLRVTDSFAQTATQAFALAIVPLPTIPATSFAAAIPTLDYSSTVTVADGTGPYTWALVAGTLPPGTSLTAAVISGSPTAGSTGVYNFTLRVTDANGQSATAVMSITVLASQANSRLIAATPDGNGYWVASSDGSIAAFGNAQMFGSQPQPLDNPIVGMQSTPTGGGYWLDAADGGVFAFGDAHFYGSMGGVHLKRAILGMAVTPTGQGYWLVASDGGVFAFGDAQFYGSTGGVHLNRRVLGMAATPTGAGYWLVAADGGVFAFGDAGFSGSMGGTHVNRPIVGMAATPDGHGYWLVASDGGIFALGNAAYLGSFGGQPLNQPMTGMAATADGGGYWLVANDGGVFNFGDAQFKGSRA